MNIGALTDDFRNYTDDNKEPYLWSDNRVHALLGEAQDEASFRGRLIFDKTTPAVCTIAVTAGTSVYSLHKSINEITYATITDANGNVTVLGSVDRVGMDVLNPYWRTDANTPSAFIQDDTSIELNAPIAESFTLNLEVYRGPLKSFTNSPEIALVHHKHLVKWALHRAYLKNDADAHAKVLSDQYLGEFEAYFGIRPKSHKRVAGQINKPQGNTPVI